MLLRPLPLYGKGEIRSRRYWRNVLGIEESTFDKLIEEGWFK